MLGTHMWSGSYHDRYEAVYLLWMFLPVLYALLLYRMRTLSWKVILILDAVYLAAVLLLSQDITCSAGMMEAFLLSIVILFLAIKRGILPGKKRLLYLAADGLPDGKRGDRLYCQHYSAGKAMLFLLNIAGNIQQEQHGFSLLGGGKISEALLFTSDQNNGTWSLSQESCTTYIIHSIFLWFGIIVGVLVIVALFAFALYALRVALRQSNRAALLLGSVCSLSIMLRIVNAVLVNFGFGIYYTISIPFLAYGLGNCLANSLMVGVILCVFRNSNVMMEELERKTGIQTADIKRRETKTES